MEIGAYSGPRWQLTNLPRKMHIHPLQHHIISVRCCPSLLEPLPTPSVLISASCSAMLSQGSSPTRLCRYVLEYASTCHRFEPIWLYLCDHLKDCVYEKNPQIIPELKKVISIKIPKEECVRVIYNFPLWIWICVQQKEVHFEHILYSAVVLCKMAVNCSCAVFPNCYSLGFPKPFSFCRCDVRLWNYSRFNG